MKFLETMDFDDTDPGIYTGAPKIDPKTGKPLDKKGKEVDPNENPLSDNDIHDMSAVSDDEINKGPSQIVKLRKDQEPSKKEEIQEWVTILQNEFDEYVGMDFGLTAEEGNALKSGGKDIQVSDTYINMAIGNLVESQTKGNTMPSKKIITDTLQEVGLKPKLHETPKDEPPKTMKDFMNLGASKVVAERKKEVDQRVQDRTLNEIPETKENTLNETPMKTYQKKLSNPKQPW